MFVCLFCQVSSFDGHCPSHAEWLPAGLKSLPTLPLKGDGWLWSAEPDSLKPGRAWTTRYTRGHQGGAEERPSSSAGIVNHWLTHSHMLCLSYILRPHFCTENTLLSACHGHLVKHGFRDNMAWNYTKNMWEMIFHTCNHLCHTRTVQPSRFSWRCACQPPKSSSLGPTWRACWGVSGASCRGNQNREARGREPAGTWRTPSPREACSVTWGRCSVSSVVCCIRCSSLTPTLPSWSTFR